MMTAKMDKAPLGAGERAERDKRRRMIWSIVALAVAGGIAGGVMGATETGEGGIMGATISAPLAIVLALVSVTAMTVGAYFLWRGIDEHELAINLWASTFAGSVYATVYPAWFFLWKGRLVPEPNHLVLFFLFFVATGVGYVFKKTR